MTTSEYTVDGLDKPVEILLDEWGVPHIYAQSTSDVYFAQGFNVARDRLWQLDFWRRRGLGLLSEVFGDRLVPWDRAARRLIYRKDMRAEWLAYSNSTKSVASSFVAGINAFIDLIDRGLVNLPLEFETLHYRPAKWEPADVARIRAHGLFFNVRDEVARAFILHNWGMEIEKLRKVLSPEHDMILPNAEDFAYIVPEILEEYDLGTLPVQFLGDDLKNMGIEPLKTSSDGSNNWVLAPKKTTTGRAMIASDPHRVTSTLPSLRYITHLQCPEFDVIGGGEPILPGISIGHNGKLAFGLTIFAIDQEDIFILQLDPDNPNRYKYRDDWITFDTVEESIPVLNSEPHIATLEYSVYGPVLWKDPSAGIAISLGAAWLEPGAAPYLGSIEYMRAQTIEDFIQAMNRWAAPPENQVVADTNGRIAWKPGGLVPIRHNWDGLTPVRGDGTYQWDGFADGDQLPVRVDPPRGWFATANQMLLDPDHDPNFHVAYDWYQNYRSLRIQEMIEERDRISVEDSFAMQTDVLNIVARDLLKRISESSVGIDQRLWSELLSWDKRVAADSAGALIWEEWFWKHFAPELFSSRIRQLGFDADREKILSILLPPNEPMRDCRAIVAEVERLISQDTSLLADIIHSSLESADTSLSEKFGDDLTNWSWGAVHKGYAIHPLADLLEKAGVPATRTRTPEKPRGGSNETVGLGSYADDQRQVGGSTFRIVVDVGEWDNSLALNSPGQSGDLTSDKSQALFDRWIDHRPFPLLYSREAIQEHTVATITLRPQS